MTGRPPSREPGLLLYIMVDSVAATIDVVLAHGGEFVQLIGADAPEVTARFRDPAGNFIGLYQQRKSLLSVVTASMGADASTEERAAAAPWPGGLPTAVASADG